MKAIVEERAKGPYRDIFDFCSRIDAGECNKRVVDSLIRAGAFDQTGANRPQMLAVYESAMDANIARRKQNVDGQISLFDLAFGGEMVIQETRALPPLPDCTLRARLSMEREIAGVYITGHPLDDYRDTLSHFAFSTADLADLEEREDHGMALDGQIVEMGGILTEVKGKATKKGAYMGFITLEDLTGQIECLVFPKIYERYQGMMAPDDLVVLTGRLSIREDESPKLLVESMDSLEDWKPGQVQARPAPRTSSKPAREDAPRPAPAPVHHAPEAPRLTDAQLAAKASRKLYLRLKRADMDRAAALLALHPGSVPVYMHLPDEKITLLAPKLSWCDATDACLRRLQSAYGADNVRLVSK